MNVKLIGNKLSINGFLYVKNHTDAYDKIHWECRKLRQGTCHARAVTSNSTLSENIILYRGIEKSQHSHEPSLQEVQEAEEAAKFGKRKREHQSTHQSHSNHASDSKNRALAEIQLQACKPTKTCVKIEMNSEPTTKLPSMTRQSTHNAGSTYDNSTSAPRLIGNKLNIDGFIYTKNYSYVSDGYTSKTHWQCKRLRTGECRATAITSDTTKSNELIVFKGPDKSIHNHASCRADVEEAEKAAAKKSNSKSDIAAKAKMNVTRARASSSIDHVSKLTESGSVKKPENTERMQLGADQQNFAPTDPSNDNVHHQMRVNLIGKRLCIDGYIYTKHSNGPGVNWVCRRYRKTGCSARVSTSDPFVGEELAIYKVNDLSHHNHSSCELEVEEAELLAKLELNRSKLEDSRAPQNHNGPSDADTQDLRLRNHPLVTEEKCATSNSSGTNRPPHPKAKETSSAPRAAPSSRNRSPDSLRFIGGRLCIDGYIFVKSSRWSGRIMWECRRYRNSGCPGRASTSDTTSSEELVVYRGPDESKHNHPPSPTEVGEAEEFARTRKKFEKSKSNPGSRASVQAKSEIPQAQINHHQSLSSAKAENVEACDASSQNQLQHSEALEASRGSPISRNDFKTNRGGLLQDHGMYSKFLAKFSTNPIFDRQSVIEALKIVYSSKQGCLMAFSTVLENREKIERDLQALRNNPNAIITSLNSRSFDAIAQDESATEKNCNPKAALCASKMEESSLVMQSSNLQEVRSHQGKRGASTTSPVRQDVAMKKLSLSNSSLPSFIKKEPIMEREIICIDLTDDIDEIPSVKHELGDTCEETPSQLNQMCPWR